MGAPDAAPRGLLSRLRWRLVLVWQLRLMSALWLLKGLSAWAVILGVMPPAADASLALPFDKRAAVFQATTIFFAIIDLVAGVGLWLTAAWGGVVWLIAAGSHLMLSYFFPRVIAFDAVTAAIYVALAIVYFALTYAASRERH